MLSISLNRIVTSAADDRTDCKRLDGVVIAARNGGIVRVGLDQVHVTAADAGVAGGRLNRIGVTAGDNRVIGAAALDDISLSAADRAMVAARRVLGAAADGRSGCRREIIRTPPDNGIEVFGGV